MHCGLVRGLGWAVLCVACSVGCRETASDVEAEHDLGDDGRILLSVGSPRKDPAIAPGQAQWPAFRSPSAGPPSAAGQNAEGVSPERRQEIEADIRALIAEFNEIQADEGVDAFLDYYVAEQHDALRPAFEAALSLTAKLDQVCGQLADKLPDEKARVERVCGSLRAMHTVKLTVEELTVVREDQVELTLAAIPAPREAHVAIVDGDWYIREAEVVPFETVKPAIDVFQAAYDALQQQLQAGQTSPAELVGRLEQVAGAVDAAKAGQGGTGG